MGSGRMETPGQCDTTGWPARSEPGVDPDPRGYEKLELQRNVRRITQRSVTHTIGWKARGDLSALPCDPTRATPARKKAQWFASTRYDTAAKAPISRK